MTPEQARAFADDLQRVADAGLDHPSIVRPLSAGVEGTIAYAASEYVAAESLDIAVRHYSPAGLDMVLPFITQLAGAIDFARAAGVGHGALHPRDIFVTPDDARATGFGVVQALERLGVRAPVRRPYTAPERVDRGAWDVSADVYSLGAIAFELLTGRRPVGADIETLGSTAGPHGEAVAQAISRALADDPARRYPSALAFAAALEASSRGERTTAAIEEVRAVATGAVAAVPAGDAPRDLTVEPDDADIYVERDADPADIQLRENESVASGPADAGAEPVRPEEPEPRPDFELPREERRESERSFFDLDRETEDVIPEVQHAGFPPEPAPQDWKVESAEPGGAEPGDDWDTTTKHAPVLRPERAPDNARAPRSALRRERRPRSVILPVAVTLLLGLFVGFLAGYLVGARDTNGSGATATSSPGSPAASDRAREGSGGPPQPDARGLPRAPQTPAAGLAAKPVPPAPAATTRRAATPSPVRSSAPAPARARGRLVVRSSPAGAQVFVNGRRRGITPLAMRDLAAGTYTIRVSRDGFEDSSQRVTVGGTAVREVNLRLARRTPPQPTSFTGSLYVDSRPRGARVLLDGKEIGATPMQVSDIRAGAHVVRLELKDHRTWTAATRIVAGEVVRVTGSLERVP